MIEEVKTTSNIFDDIIAEEKFLSTAKKGEVYQLESEVDLMVKVYNEQLEQLVRIRIDVELFDYLILAEPTNNQHAQQRSQAVGGLKRKRKLIQVIRNQILQQIVGKEQEGKHGKKD